MINFIDTFCDKCFEILIICLGISFIIFTINFGQSINKHDEEDCVKFYKENNYILKGCEIYKDKLEGINE